MRRREVIAILGGGVVGWPLAAHAQRKSMPVIGYLSSNSPDIPAGEVEAWEADRNKKHTKADWQFNTANARVKLKRLYPAL